LERKKLIPFQNKSKEQVILILNSLPATHPYKLMFEFGEEVIKLLEAEHADWAQFTLEKKQQLIQEQLDTIKAEIEAEKPKIEVPNFGKTVTEEDQPAE
jgi:hypothetical protein